MFSQPHFWNTQILVLLCMVIVPTNLSEEGQKSDFVLCRMCGADLASAASIVNLHSLAAVKRESKALFGLLNVKVQTVATYLSADLSVSIQFPIFTVLEASCITKGKDWKIEQSWYPGYAWRNCLCPQCNQLIGWAFEPLHLADPEKVRASHKGFYTINLHTVISEFFSDSLLIVPQTVVPQTVVAQTVVAQRVVAR